jgi:hypothetical protein
MESKSSIEPQRHSGGIPNIRSPGYVTIRSEQNRSILSSAIGACEFPAIIVNDLIVAGSRMIALGCNPDDPNAVSKASLRFAGTPLSLFLPYPEEDECPVCVDEFSKSDPLSAG